MSTVNTNNYEIAKEYLNNTGTYEQSIYNIQNALSGLDSRIVNGINQDINTSINNLNSLNSLEKTTNNKITNIVKRYIEIENNAKTRTEALFGIATVTGVAAVTAIAPPIGIAVGSGVIAAAAKSNKVVEFFSEVGTSIASAGTKVVEGVKSISSKIFSGAAILGQKVKKTCANIGAKAVSILGKISEINQKVGEMYQNFCKSFCASIGNFFISIAEGIGSFVEAIVDAAVMLGGVCFSLVTGIFDLGQWVGSKMFKTEFSSATKAMWSKKIMPFVGNNYTDKAFDALYETKVFSAIEKTAWGPFKREGGTIYSIGKGVGYTTGVILSTVLTCGVAPAGSILASSTAVSTGLSAAGAFGKSAQSNYNALTAEQQQDGEKIMKVLLASTASGLVEGAAWYFTFGNGKAKFLDKDKGVFSTSKIVTNTSKIWNKAVQGIFNNRFTAKGLSRIAEALSTDGVKMAKMGIQFVKTYVNTGINASVASDSLGEVIDSTFTKETFTSASANSIISLIYDNTLSSKLKNTQNNVKNNVASKYNLKEYQKTLEELKKAQEATSTQQSQANTLFDSADDAIVDQNKDAATQAANELILQQKIDEIKAIQSLYSDGISKTVGGLIKKIIDIRKYPDIIAECN